MLRHNLKKLLPLQPVLRSSLAQHTRVLPAYSLISSREASTKYNDKNRSPRSNEKTNTSSSRSKERKWTPKEKLRLVEVNSPFAKANKLLYAFPEDPYVASERVARILQLGEVEDAEDYIRALPIYLQSVVVWNQLLGHCAKFGKSQFAEKYYSKMRKRAIEPNEQTVTQMLKCYVESDSQNAIQNAEAWFAKLNDFDLKPTIIHCNNLMRVYSRHGEPEKTIDFLKHLKQNGDLVPDAITYTIALWACPNLTKVDQLKTIESIWEELMHRVDKSQKNTEPGDSVLSEKASKIASSEKSLAVLKKFDDTELHLDEQLVLALLNAVGRSARSAKDAVVGLEVIERVYSLCPPKAANIMKVNNVNRKPGFGLEPSAKALSSILRFACNIREYGLGEQYFKLAESQYPRLKLDDHVYDALDYIKNRSKKGDRNTKQTFQRRK